MNAPKKLGECVDLPTEIRSCRACAGLLPFEPRPLVQLSPTARILIVSQAPGRIAHATGITFDDASGARLRDWLNVSRELFYDPTVFAIAAMGFCYPGRGGAGDAPPRPECALLWRTRVEEYLSNIRLTLLVGIHAQNHYLGRGQMTERVKNFEQFLPRFFPLPHPSWRTTSWMSRNPWFEGRVLPSLRAQIDGALPGG
ncbi:uracil-DNA glycosylase family protein [Frigidibacter sp. MR17.14]|uniref:uracil-DNA glycosylase family protein n=1 Tax=Frigidibacter sp. MR17.14 TaxID=3126509 RepID=UPI003012ACA2